MIFSSFGTYSIFVAVIGIAIALTYIFDSQLNSLAEKLKERRRSKRNKKNHVNICPTVSKMANSRVA